MSEYSPPSPDQEPYKVLIHKGELTDSARDCRVVPYKIYYPVEHGAGRLPVVVWSHGLGGSRDGAAFLTRYLAANGYIVVNVQHAGTDSSIWEGKPGHPWDIIRATKIPREASLDRFHDVHFMLDHLKAVADEKEEIGNYIDLDVMGMSGHSFGALTTQVLAGMPFPDLSDKFVSFRDERFRAGILYSFVPMRHLKDEALGKVYGRMDIPLFFMTGTADENPISGQGYEYRLPVFEQAGCPEKSLLVLEEGDHMVFAGSRGKLGDNPKRKTHEDIIKVTSLAFWDAYLKKDKRAHAWLADGGAQAWLGDEGTYRYE